MKRICTLKRLLVASFIGAASVANGQTTTHPLAYAGVTVPTVITSYYKDYVGLRLTVTNPPVIAGDKNYTTSYSTGTGSWGGTVTTPIVDDTVIMGTGATGEDSFACSAFSTSFSAKMVGKIAVIWRGPIGSAGCEFGYKALQCQNAGAKAIVIINEFPNQPPVGMGAGASGASVTIPVFMISNQDGLALSGQYRSNPFGTVRMTISPWGSSLGNDLGFVPQGAALWANYAIPYAQLTGAGATAVPYQSIDGAFVANYGTSKGVNVKLSSNTTFNGGASIHSSTFTSVPVFDNTTSLTTHTDSIWAMFGAPYFLSGITGPGEVKTTYTISSDTATDAPSDTTASVSFFVTDSLYSKGRYDLANNVPISGQHESFNGGAEFIWGPTYYVANGGSYISHIQHSLASNTAGALAGSSNIFIFKWQDGSNTLPMDSIAQLGELTLVGIGTHFFGDPSDTSGGVTTTTEFTNAAGDTTINIPLNANTWYYLAADVQGSLFLGIDNGGNPIVRNYGRWQANRILDYSSILSAGTLADITTNGGQGTAPFPIAGPNFIKSVDSFIFHHSKGLIPSVAMISTTHPLPPVKTTTPPAKAFTSVTLFPNPATDVLNVDVNLVQPAKVISYMIMDGLGRFVSRTTHNNIQNDQFTISTANLSSGNYYLAITVDGKTIAKTFTVVK